MQFLFQALGTQGHHCGQTAEFVPANKADSFAFKANV